MSDNTLLNQATETLNEPSTPSTVAIVDTEKKKTAKKKNDDLNGVEVLEYPNRTLPRLIEELLEKDIPVQLSKNGYYVGGFYGLSADAGKKGFAFAQDTTEANALVFYDNKNHRHLVKTFEDLVKFHNHVWGLFFKVSDDYRKPDSLWFGYMLQLGVLSITPGAVK